MSRRSAFGELDSDYAIAWQDFKPQRFAGFERITPEWVFIRNDIPPGDVHPFNETDPASSGLQELLLLFPGALVKQNAATTNFEPLVKTGTNTGTLMVKDVIAARNDPSELRRWEGPPTRETYVLAAHITGKPKSPDNLDEDSAADKASTDKPSTDKPAAEKSPAEKPAADAKAADAKQPDKAEAKKDDKSAVAADQDKTGGINVILVADVDMLHSEFFDLRARRLPDTELRIDADNVTFVLNVLDVLAGDMRFVDVRNRQPLHRPLSTVVARTQDARDKAEGAVNEFNKAARDEEDKLTKEINATKGLAAGRIGQAEARREHRCTRAAAKDDRIVAQTAGGRTAQGSAGRTIAPRGAAKNRPGQPRADFRRARRAGRLQIVERDFAAGAAAVGGVFRVLPSPHQGTRRGLQSTPQVKAFSRLA